MCLCMTYTELVAIDDYSMLPNIELPHQIIVYCYLQANSRFIEIRTENTSGVRTYKYLGILQLVISTYQI